MDLGCHGQRDLIIGSLRCGVSAVLAELAGQGAGTLRASSRGTVLEAARRIVLLGTLRRLRLGCERVWLWALVDGRATRDGSMLGIKGAEAAQEGG